MGGVHVDYHFILYTRLMTVEGNTHLYDKLHLDRKPGSELEITGEIPVAVVSEQREQAISALGKETSLPGFRKGKVPHDVLVKHFGEERILTEVAERVLARAYPDIVINEKLDVVGRPAVSLTKLAPNNPIGFRIQATLMPEVTLPDYKALATKARESTTDPNASTVTEEEIEEVIKRIRQDAAHQKHHEDHPDDTQHAHGEFKEEDLPLLDDNFVKSLGNFASVDEFRTRIREGLAQEKEMRQKEKERIAIVDAVVSETKVEVPNLFIESELGKMAREMEQNIARMGLTMEGYLARIEKSREELIDGWRPEAEKRAKVQLVLNKIAQDQNIEPEEALVEREITHILEHYSDADPDSVRLYVTSMLRNEAVFRFLEEGPTASKEA
jgi:trigger factor